jgi:hypothetical protein
VKGVVAAQLREPLVPVDHVAPAVDALAARDGRAQVVIDALARDTAEPLECADMPLQEGLDRRVEGEVRGRRPRERQREHQRVNAPLPAGDPRPRRHLGPIDLQHLPRPIARPLRRPLRPRPQQRQAPADQIDRPRVAMLVAQDLRHPRRLDVLPVGDQPAKHRLERVEHRPRRRPRIARRLARLDHPLDRPPIDSKPPGDLALRHPVRGHRLDLSPLQRASHLPRRLLDPVVADGLETPGETGGDQPSGALFAS